MNGKTPSAIFRPPLIFRLLSVVVFFKQLVLVFLAFVFFKRICWTHLVNEDSKILVKYYPDLRGHKSINLSVLNSNKAAFVMKARRWHLMYLWSESTLGFIHHFWSVLATSFWLEQINCVWASLHVLPTESCVLDLVSLLLWSGLYQNHIAFQTKDGLDEHYHCICFF